MVRRPGTAKINRFFSYFTPYIVHERKGEAVPRGPARGALVHERIALASA